MFVTLPKRIQRRGAAGGALLTGLIEMDETYVGGKPRNNVVGMTHDAHDAFSL